MQKGYESKKRRFWMGILQVFVSLLLLGMLAGCGNQNGTKMESESSLPPGLAQLAKPIETENQGGAEKALEDDSRESTDIVNGSSSSENNTNGDGEIDSATELEALDENSQGKHLSDTPKVKGIYVTGPVAGSDRMEELIDLVSSTDLNTIVLDIKNDEGNVTYKMELDSVQEMNAGIRYIADFPTLIERLHQLQIYVIGRIVCFKDPILAESNPSLKLYTPDGRAVVDANGLPFVNPYRQEVWSYLVDVAKKAYGDGVDEIQFDYVRFPVGQDAESADYGVDITEYPKQKGLEDYFRYLREELGSAGIPYGADLFGTVIGSNVDMEKTGQDYGALACVSDVLSPMIYPSHYANGTFGFDVPDAHPYDAVFKALSKSKEVIENKGAEANAIIRPWLQCFNATWVPGHIDYDAAAIKAQIQAVYDSGYEEWLLWNAANHYDQVYAALQE